MDGFGCYGAGIKTGDERTELMLVQCRRSRRWRGLAYD